MQLIQPVPLYFEIAGEGSVGEEKVLFFLAKRDYSTEEMALEMNVSESYIRKLFRKLVGKGLAVKRDPNTRPVLYGLT